MTGKTKNDIQLIDLGLPSGTLWADRNIGAESPEGYGYYFRFGETTPFTEDSQPYVYDDIKADIAGTDRDAATVILGGKWRMPTKAELQELIKNCDSEWTEDYNGTGMAGRLFTSKTNGNSVFFPAAGLRDYGDGSLIYVSLVGYYWSASPCGCKGGRCLYLYSSDFNCYNDYRTHGYPVRAVNG